MPCCLLAYQILLTLSASQTRLRRSALIAQIKKNEIGWAYGTDRRRERVVQGEL